MTRCATNQFRAVRSNYKIGLAHICIACGAFGKLTYVMSALHAYPLPHDCGAAHYAQLELSERPDWWLLDGKLVLISVHTDANLSGLAELRW
jgi:hypothetical protein